VTQPLLYLAGGRAVLVAVGRKVLAEPMQNPVLAHWGVSTRDGLAVLDALALATVQTTLECNHLEPANQMTIGLAMLPENQGRPVLACRQLGDQLVGDWDDTLFAIFRFETEVGLLDDRNCLFLGVDVWVFANADFRLSHPCTEEESPEESVVFGGDRRLVPRGGGIGSEGLPRPFAVTLGALVVGCFGMVFLGAPYKAPERTQTGLAVEDRSAI
jgi:hypothetical protein